MHASFAVAVALLLLLSACHSLMNGNAVRVVEERRSIAYCQELGEVEASVPASGRDSMEGPMFEDEYDHQAEDALTDEVLAKGGDTLYGVTTEAGFNQVTARGTAYFCDRANKPNDYQK